MMNQIDPLLHMRAMEALNRRNLERRQQASDQGFDWNPSYEEKADPNGVWNDVLQGVEESGGGMRSKMGSMGPGLGVNTLAPQFQTPESHDPNASPEMQSLLAIMNKKYPGVKG